MERIERNNWAMGFGASLLVHMLLAGAIPMAAWITRSGTAKTVEIDMTQAPPVPSLPARPQAMRKEWVRSKSGKMAPVPDSLTETAESEAQISCPPPCPETPGAYMPSGLAARAPRMRGSIDTSDYPRQALKQGLEAKVLTELFIDSAGKVREVRVLNEAPEIFKAWVREKMMGLEFDPAYDEKGLAIPVLLKLPISFVLD
jgi:hypothetical protein